jgi:hypothetical protein
VKTGLKERCLRGWNGLIRLRLGSREERLRKKRKKFWIPEKEKPLLKISTTIRWNAENYCAIYSVRAHN